MIRSFTVLALTSAIAAPLAAQAPTAQGSPAPVATRAVAAPSTPAGAALRAFLDAFNSGDSAQIRAFAKRYEPKRDVEETTEFAEQTGGFDLISIERSEPGHVEYTLHERKSPMVAYGMLDLVAGDPSHVRDIEFRPMGPHATIADARIDASKRREVVERSAALLDSFYVFPDVAKRTGDSLRARLKRGEYDRYENGYSYAFRLDADLTALAHDGHMHMNYSGKPLPAQMGGEPAPRTPAQLAEDQARVDEFNCAFPKAEVLPGNVGYVKIDGFADVELCAGTAAAAMNFVAGTRALILDLRENHGGSPAMVSYVASFLFDTRTHLNDLWTRSTNHTEEFWTRDSVPGRRFGGTKPIYVLTSGQTFSGGEELTYDLKTQKRATIVGETTGGGAHPVRGRRIDDHFMLGVPFARAINPITKTNWEHTGVEPDVKVPATDALATAQRMLKDTPPPQP